MIRIILENVVPNINGKLGINKNKAMVLLHIA